MSYPPPGGRGITWVLKFQDGKLIDKDTVDISNYRWKIVVVQ